MDAMGREPGPRSWTARIIAPLFLLVVVAAVVIVISNSLSSDDDSNSTDGATARQAQTSGCSDEARAVLKDGYYVVQAEDTAGLSGIAAKTCTTVNRLEELNPNLDPQALQVENCVDLVPDGCKKLAG